jgi:5-formyltetrahydrofolate cyclo-ligase
MAGDDTAVVVERKRQIREQAQARRAAQSDKDQLSRQIVTRLMALPEFAASHTVMFYVDVRDEVRTQPGLPALLRGQKRVIVPYCDGDQLSLFHLQDMNELAVGKFGVLEPRPELRTDAARCVALEEVDLIVVPGVAFDRHGGRLGHGQGYYDRLLISSAYRTTLVGLAFECQVFHQIPVQPHDVSVDRVVTESAVYIGRGPSSGGAVDCGQGRQRLYWR